MLELRWLIRRSAKASTNSSVIAMAAPTEFVPAVLTDAFADGNRLPHSI
jgi:hypothetical protein